MFRQSRIMVVDDDAETLALLREIVVKEGYPRANRAVVRIRVNAGSVEKELLAKHRGPTAKALVESAARSLRICEKARFRALKFSLKASDVNTTIEAYRLFSRRFDYPLHVGVTEAGTLFSGTVKSSVGLGVLLAEGIGDTLRVSLTGPPEVEVRVGWQILKALGLRRRGPDFVSCPTCGRDRHRGDRDRGGAAPLGSPRPAEDRGDGLRRQQFASLAGAPRQRWV